MSTTRKRDRIIALAVALFFFVLASALSVLVIYQLVTTKKNNQPSTTATTTPTQTLAGTQLANFTPVSSVPTLLSTDTQVGTGQAATASDTVTVNYTGAIASTGIIFQSTQDTGKAVSLSLDSVIKGWQEGIPGMKVGGIRRLVIPAADAYGATPPSGSGIPANAPLVFDIQLVKIGS